ncbi:MAG TPA: alpha-N-arabinofuranosidase [Candidatus Dormibacteraeota bacterium]|nr:alpha-N-arabinofuranosidase [Candidatus Dormibacteraeota bacterium]
MPFDSRRSFLKRASAAGIAISAHHLLAPFVRAQTAGSASAIFRFDLDSRRVLPALDRNIFGSFLEHLGRAIYEGIYDPNSKFADANGFRKDVLEEIQKLQVPIIRYPGGNFVSGYHWLDGVGPKQERPKVLDKAWNSLETNQFGINEFLLWCKAVGTQPLLGLNLGTGTPESAAALVEYCNVDKGTKWSDLRRKHGIADPHKVTHWCLGNEMDGPWQIGHMSAAEYGEKAADAARQMRYVDPSLKLIACGSSGPTMPTYLEWDREVLEQCYDYVDAISLHRYFDNTSETGGDTGRFLALNLSMERQIAEVAAVCDYVQGRKRSPKKLWLSFDEWNVWYRARSGSAMDGDRKEAPHLLEEVYNLEDALLVGGLINSLLRNSGRVRVACLAQLVNVIAPIMTNANGLYRQTIYYPYNWALHYARGAALDVLVEPGPSYEVPGYGQVPYLDVAGTLNPDDGTVSLFVLNRDLTKSHQLELNWEAKAGSRLLASYVLTGSDLKAVNGFDAPQRVAPQAAEKPITSGGVTKVELPPRSYSVYQWGV